MEERSPHGEVGSLYEHVLLAFPGMSDQCGCLALGAVSLRPADGHSGQLLSREMSPL